MQTILHNHEIAGALIARVFLGFLFFFQGFDAVFRIKISGVIDAIEEPLAERGIPRALIVTGAWFTSYIELIAGVLLIIGFAKYYALYLLGMNLVVASVAFGIIKPMWDTSHAFVRLALLLFLLMIPSEWDVVSVDYVWSLINFLKSIA